MKLGALLAFSLLAASSVAVGADVYKWQDASGRTVFSDRPPSGVSAQKLGVRAAPAPKADASAPASRPPLTGAAALKAESEALNGKVDAYNRQVRAENCKSARGNVERLQSAKPRNDALVQSALAVQKEWCAE
ncbi:DUF4124 domain-containing protein [Crenobacter caeni]|uniref:DUF4124 domain-containing protein n=1 Tax=Crenobacter caeni TaxID=2705474 RepID=A0A6B2KWG5_9NEIS|nr:DUF4124 domain-containing protein [Crenobacter caeni]NDV14330.1 DUF4124 domain-containing protein [Crenobacter caeni]